MHHHILRKEWNIGFTHKQKQKSQQLQSKSLAKKLLEKQTKLLAVPGNSFTKKNKTLPSLK